MNEKPILFNTDMVRGLLANRKTVTRRVVKAQHLRVLNSPYRQQHPETPDKVLLEKLCEPPYHPGDILYVRETWTMLLGSYLYRANQKPGMKNPGKWRPSIHMPREAARIFLRVTDVRAERLQDSFFKHGSTIFSLRGEGIDIGEQCRECIETYGSPCCIDDESECGVLDEVRGMFADLWNRCYAKPRPIKGEDGTIDHYESYPWEDIQETRTYRGKPWYVIGNPWVWAIEFERISREEAMRRDA